MNGFIRFDEQTEKSRGVRGRTLNRLLFLPVVFMLALSHHIFLGASSTTPVQQAIDQHQQKKPNKRWVGFGSDYLWRINPSFRFGTIYESNVNREPPHQRDEDIVLNYSPAVDLRRLGTRLSVSANYQMDFQEFLRDPDQSSFNHQARWGVQIGTQKVHMGVGSRFAWTKTHATSEQSERRTVIINEVHPEIKFRLSPKLSVSSVYRNNLFGYRDSVLKDRSYVENDVGGRIYYHMRPKLDLYMEGTGTTIDYYRSGVADSNGFTLSVGSAGRLTRKVLVDVQTGFKGQFYEDEKINAFTRWVVGGNVYYRLTRKVSTVLSLQRDKQESVYRDTNWYEANRVALAVNYRLTARTAISTDGSLQLNRYPVETTEGETTKRRRDSIMKSGLKLTWRPIRNLMVQAGYTFRTRLSNFDNRFDYLSHSLDSSVTYQFG